MIGELTRHLRQSPPQDVLREAWDAWRHGVLVLLTLALSTVVVIMVAALAWFAANVLPLLLVEGWTFNRSLDAFGWTWPIWGPLAYSWGSRYLPPHPAEAKPVRS